MKHQLTLTFGFALLRRRCRLPGKLIVSGCLAALGSSFLLAQGPLAPPGAPAPTMKTLDQIEPRKPISQPAVGGFPIAINAPGSYYLTGNITGASGTDGIRINVGGVTIDLNGFEVTGTGGSATASMCRRRSATLRSVMAWCVARDRHHQRRPVGELFLLNSQPRIP
jgi:hypothetical protein